MQLCASLFGTTTIIGLTNRMVLIAALIVPTYALADDQPAIDMRVATSQSGELEIFALDSKGTLYNRVQTSATPASSGSTTPSCATSPPPSNFSAWTALENGPASRLQTLRGVSNNEVYVATLNQGHATLDHESTDNGGWGKSTNQFGANLGSLATAQTKSGRLLIAGVDSDGRLYKTSESAPGSNSWPAMQQTGIAGLNSGLPPATKISSFVTTPNLLASALRADGRLSVFSVTDAGTILSVTEDGPDGKLDIQENLGPLRVTALSATASAGRILLLALDQSSRLEARVNAADGTWSDWAVLLDGVTDWDAIADSFGGVVVIASTGGQLRSSHLLPSGQWAKGHLLVDPTNGCAILPLRGPSLVMDDAKHLTLAARDDAGTLFVRTMPAVDDDAGFSDAADWIWFGKVSVAENPPDFVVQTDLCLPPSEDALVKSLLQAQLAETESDPVLSSLAAHVGVLTRCDQTSNGAREIIGVWLSEQPSSAKLPEEIRQFGKNVEPTAFEVTPTGLGHLTDAEWDHVDKRYDSNSGQPSATGDATLTGHELKINKGNFDFKTIGNLAVEGESVKFNLDIKAQVSTKQGMPDCSGRLSISTPGIDKLLKWSNIVAPVLGQELGENLIQRAADSVKQALLPQTQILCELDQAFPVWIFLGQINGPPQQWKLVFNYDNADITPAKGITFYSHSEFIPQRLNPSISFEELTGGAIWIDKNTLGVDVIPHSTDMLNPTFTWKPTWPGSSVRAPWHNIPGAVQLVFPRAPNALAGTPLGSLTVTATDTVGQSAQVINSFVLTEGAVQLLHPTPKNKPPPVKNQIPTQ